MTCRGGTTSSEEEIAAAIDRVLNGDRRRESRVKGSREGSRETGEATKKPREFNDDSSGSSNAKTQDNGSAPKPMINYCCCRAGVMSRFSLMVMEALRSLERESNTFTISSVDDIVEHIQQNYATNGDVYAQSLTALKQVSAQGFVLEMLKDEYHLVGPLANSMNESLMGRTDCLPGDKSLESCQRRGCTGSSRRQSGCSPCRRQNLCEPSRDTENRSSADFEEDSSVDVESQETDNCGCATQKRKNEGNSDNLREKRVRRASGDFEGNISMRTRAASQKSRNTRRNQNVDKDSTTEESNDVDDQDFQERRSSNSRPQSKKRSEELKEWIQRCQEECKRRACNRR